MKVERGAPPRWIGGVLLWKGALPDWNGGVPVFPGAMSVRNGAVLLFPGAELLRNGAETVKPAAARFQPGAAELRLLAPKERKPMFEVAEELSVGIKDEPGSLSAVLKVVADAGCAVRAFCGYSMAGAGNVMLVPDDAKKAKAALKKAGYSEIESSKVVVGTTKDKKGAGADITIEAQKKGINLEYAYATGTGKGTGVIVLAAGGNTAKLAKALNG